MTRFVKKQKIALLLSLLLMLVLLPLRASAEDDFCVVSIPVRVSLDEEIDTEHVILISAEEEIPMPAQSVLKIQGSGQASFESITYTEPGDYEYLIVQQEGDEPYLIYDDTVYHVTVRVTNDSKGNLVPEIWAVENEQTGKVEELLFENVYDPSGSKPSPSPSGEPSETPGTQPSPTPSSAPGTAPGTDPTPGPGGGEGGSSEPVPSAQPTPTGILSQFYVPQTSDQFPLILLVVIMCLAAAGFGFGYYHKKHQKGDNEHPSDSTK